jgi:MtN3 and saliva related transmembrane protein
MAAFWLDNLVGSAAALCSMASFLPQVVKIARERDASAVSLRMYAITVTGFSLWTLYGVLLASWPLIVSNLISLSLSGTVLALKWRYGKSKGPGEVPRPSPYPTKP